MRTIDLKGKVAIVTGSIQGIGLEIARTLATAGAHVIINNHQDPAELEKSAESIRAAGGQATAVMADLTKEEEAAKLVAAADELGGVDILVNNAGGLVGRVPVAEFDENHFNTIIAVNVKTSFIMAKLCIPSFRAKQGGKVINLASQAAHDGGGPGAAAYSAAKGAIWTFTKSLAKELGPVGVTVNAVSPGFIAGTAFHNTFTSPEVHEKVKGMVPIGRLGEPADIAKVILFLASDLGDYVNGQSIEVNGGLYMP